MTVVPPAFTGRGTPGTAFGAAGDAVASPPICAAHTATLPHDSGVRCHPCGASGAVLPNPAPSSTAPCATTSGSASTARHPADHSSHPCAPSATSRPSSPSRPRPVTDACRPGGVRPGHSRPTARVQRARASAGSRPVRPLRNGRGTADPSRRLRDNHPHSRHAPYRTRMGDPVSVAWRDIVCTTMVPDPRPGTDA